MRNEMKGTKLKKDDFLIRPERPTLKDAWARAQSFGHH
jgi:hypothetical protein